MIGHGTDLLSKGDLSLNTETYPLIDEAKKEEREEPDIEKMTEWVKSTSNNLNELNKR